MKDNINVWINRVGFFNFITKVKENLFSTNKLEKNLIQQKLTNKAKLVVPNWVPRRKRISQCDRSRHDPVPPWLAVEIHVVSGRVHGTWHIGDAAPGQHDLWNGVGVEFTGDGEAEFFLVSYDGRLQSGVERIGQIRRGQGFEVPEALKVLLQLRHAADVAPPPGIDELGEAAPCVVFD